MRIRYTMSGSRFLLDLSGHNNVVCTAPAVRVADAAVLFAVSPGEREMVPRERLKRVAEELLARVEADFDLLQYTYAFVTSTYGGGGAGMMGGIRIDGKIHSLGAGPGMCQLEEMAWEPGQRARVVRRVDVRSEKTIQTENCGTITISRRKKRLTIHQQLKELIAFLDQQTDEVVEKSLDEGEPRPMDLIRELQGGEGLEEDWIRERLHQLGDPAVQELIERYGTPGARKYRDTIAYILKDWYTPIAVRPRLQALVTEAGPPQRKRLYEELLDSLNSWFPV